MINLNKNELDILRPILEECKDRLANKSCNDVKVPNTAENRKLLRELRWDNVRGNEEVYKKEYSDCQYEKAYANGDPIQPYIYFQDWWIFSYLMKKAGF